MAFGLADGKTVWQVAGEQASYSSPKLVQRDGVEHALFVTRYNFLSLDPATGDVRFRLPFGKRGPTVNAATPVVKGNHVFLSASYGIGARWVEFGSEQAKVVGSWDDLMSSQYATCVVEGDAFVDCFAGVESVEGHVGVLMFGRCDRDVVDVFDVEQRTIVGESVLGPRFGGSGSCTGFPTVGDCDGLDVVFLFDFVVGVHVGVRHAASTDEADADTIVSTDLPAHSSLLKWQPWLQLPRRFPRNDDEKRGSVRAWEGSRRVGTWGAFAGGMFRSQASVMPGQKMLRCVEDQPTNGERTNVCSARQ